VFVALLVAAGVRAAPGVLIVPLEQSFGWSRATVSFAVSVNLLLYGLIGPFAAGLIERIGVRPTMLLSMAMLLIGLLLTTVMTAVWQMVLLWGIVIGLGSGLAAVVLGAVVANRWFVHRRGLVIGVLTASMAAGQLVFLPFLARLIEVAGWRAASFVLAGCAAVMLIPIALLMRERPEDLGLRPFGETGEAAPRARQAAPAGIFAALGEGAQSRDFWLLFISFFVCGLSTNGLIGTHLVPACLDHGIPEVAAASLLAGMGVFNFLGTTASGWLSDRFDNRWLLFWYYGLRGLSLMFLPYSFDLSVAGLSVFVVFYGLDWIATVPPTVRLAADAFGAAKGAMMFGWIMAGHQIGSAVAAFGAGLVRTQLGDYFSAFVLAGILCLAAALLVLRIRSPQARQPIPVAAEA
jgi:predicted MFS family arabinose efflux permease